MGKGESDLGKEMSSEEEIVGWRHSGNAEWGLPPQQGMRKGSSLAGLGEKGEAFSCFAEVASVGPWPPGLAMDVAPARLPARQPLLALADLPECT